MTDYFDMTGKVVLITGGSRGLGLEMAKGFATQGADIVVASRKIDDCRAAAAAIEAMGRRALAHACHVGRWDELDGLVEAAATARPDVIVPLCTNLPATRHAVRWEATFGIPIFDSIAVAARAGLVLAGLSPALIEGWGRLFQF